MAGLSGKEKATLLLAIIGPQRAAQLLRRLPEEVADLLAAKVATLPQPSEDQISFLWGELSRNMLEAPPEVKSIAAPDAVSSTSEIPVDPYSSDPNVRLNSMLPIKIVEILRNETIRVQKFVMTLLSENKSKDVMNILDHNRKKNLDQTDLDDFPFLDEVRPVVISAILNYYEDTNVVN